MTSELLEVAALDSDKSAEELLDELTYMPPDKLEDLAESHLNSLLPSGQEYHDYDSRSTRAAAASINTSTYKQREIEIQNFCEWYSANEKTHLKQDTVEEYYQYKLNNDYAPGTVDNRYWQLIAWISRTSKFKKTMENQARDAREQILRYINERQMEYEVPEGGADPISKEQKDILIEYIKNVPERPSTDSLRDEVIIRLLWQTGVRASELADIRISTEDDEDDEDDSDDDTEDDSDDDTEDDEAEYGDIHLDERTITIRTAKRTDGDTRPVQFNPVLKNYLEEWIHVQREKYITADDSPYLIPTRESEQIYPQNLSARVKNLAEDAGIQQYGHDHQNGADNALITPHSFRKAFGRRRIRLGDSIEKVRELLGHKKLETTQQYLNLTKEDLGYDPQS